MTIEVEDVKKNGERERRSLDIRVLIRYLLDHEDVYLSQIARDLNVNRGTVQYHLNKLVSKGVVITREDGGVTKYTVNYSIIDTRRDLILAILPTSILILAVSSLFLGSLILSLILSMTSALTSIPLLWKLYIDKVTNKLELIMKELHDLD